MLAFDMDIGVLGTLLTVGEIPVPLLDLKPGVDILMLLVELVVLIGVLKDMMRKRNVNKGQTLADDLCPLRIDT